MSENKPLEGKVALVTGASRGLGAAVAKAYARAGAHVILAARTVGGLEEVDDVIRAEGGSATLVPIDLCEGDKIDQLGAGIFERWGKLDILVANAGLLGQLGPIAHIDPKLWSKVMEVNVNANWRLIRSVDPLLRAADAGRALFVTSAVTDRSAPYWGAYAVSKAALEALVATYAEEVVETAVKAHLIDPGALRTAMRAKAYPGEDPLTLPRPEQLTQTFIDLAMGHDAPFKVRAHVA